MGDAETANAPTDDLVSRMKAEIESLRAGKAMAEASNNVFVDRERQRVGAWSEEVKYLIQTWAHDETDAEGRIDMAPLHDWSNNYSNKDDIAGQTALGRLCYTASKGIKRLRDEASSLKIANDTHAETVKRLEEVENERNKLQRDFTGMSELATERATSIEALQKIIAEAGLMNNTSNFSNLASREKNAHLKSSDADQTMTGLEAVKAEASKNGKGRANPLEDPLYSFISSKGSGGATMPRSSTAHAILGCQGGSMDIGSLLKVN